MSPSIFQLQAVGVQDIYLTKEPEINVFKYNYYRYVNFATETVEIPLNDNIEFGNRMTCDIPRKGHLLSKLHLHIKLPKLVKKDGKYLSWCDTLGYNIFSDAIELQIGGIVVDRLYPEFLNIWDELSNPNKKSGKNLMILKSDLFSSTFYNADRETDLIIPLDFWFTKQYNLALPLLSILHQDIRVSFKLKEFANCVNYDGSDPDPVQILNSSIFAEYIYLDGSILSEFQKKKHMFLIDQQQFNGVELINENKIVHSSNLKFNHPCKEVIFYLIEKNNINTNNYCSYSRSSDETSLITRASLLLDGKPRFDALPEFYYRSIFPECVHSVIPMKYIFCMPFSLKPEDNQPTGSINLSRFNDVTLYLNMKQNNKECMLYTYAISYNIIKIEDGILKLEFLM